MSSHDTHADIGRSLGPDWGRTATRTCGWICALAGAVFVLGLFLEPHRTWTGFLMGFHVLLGLALAGPVGLAFLHLSGARWARRIEVVPRAMAAAVPAAAAMGLLLLFGAGSLFEWTHAAHVEGDAILEQKQAYLNFPFFAARLVVFFALWWWAGRAVVRASAESRGDDPASKRRRLRAGAVFLLAFAPTFSLASIDWLQSLEPHWFSSIYALYTLAGLGLSGLAAGIVLVVALDRRGEVAKSTYGDLGALLVSLAIFWGYIWYCQYLLIWYTNLPEETVWYAARLGGAWGSLTKLTCVVCSALPFVLLLFRRMRRSRGALVRIAVLVLFGRLLDVLVLAGPPLMGDLPVLGVWEIAPIAGEVALFFLFAVRALQRSSAAADPVLPAVGLDTSSPTVTSADPSREPAHATS